MENIIISKRLVKKDGKCVVCEYKEKEINKGFGYSYNGIFIDEIRLINGKLSSSYYYSNEDGDRVIYSNLSECLKELGEGKYNKFKKVYIRKINNIK